MNIDQQGRVRSALESLLCTNDQSHAGVGAIAFDNTATDPGFEDTGRAIIRHLLDWVDGRPGHHQDLGVQFQLLARHRSWLGSDQQVILARRAVAVVRDYAGRRREFAAMLGAFSDLSPSVRKQLVTELIDISGDTTDVPACADVLIAANRIAPKSGATRVRIRSTTCSVGERIARRATDRPARERGEPNDAMTLTPLLRAARLEQLTIGTGPSVPCCGWAPDAESQSVT